MGACPASCQQAASDPRQSLCDSPRLSAAPAFLAEAAAVGRWGLLLRLLWRGPSQHQELPELSGASTGAQRFTTPGGATQGRADIEAPLLGGWIALGSHPLQTWTCLARASSANTLAFDNHAQHFEQSVRSWGFWWVNSLPFSDTGECREVSAWGTPARTFDDVGPRVFQTLDFQGAPSNVSTGMGISGQPSSWHEWAF